MYTHYRFISMYCNHMVSIARLWALLPLASMFFESFRNGTAGDNV